MNHRLPRPRHSTAVAAAFLLPLVGLFAPVPTSPARAEQPATAPSTRTIDPPLNGEAWQLSPEERNTRLRRGADRYRAELAVQDARRAEAENRTADALRSYNEALWLDPENAAALDGSKRLKPKPSPESQPVVGDMLIGNGPGTATTYLISDSITRAKQAIEDGDWEAAETAIHGAIAARDQADRRAYSDKEFAAFNASIDQGCVACVAL